MLLILVAQGSPLQRDCDQCWCAWQQYPENVFMQLHLLQVGRSRCFFPHYQFARQQQGGEIGRQELFCCAEDEGDQEHCFKVGGAASSEGPFRPSGSHSDQVPLFSGDRLQPHHLSNDSKVGSPRDPLKAKQGYLPTMLFLPGQIHSIWRKQISTLTFRFGSRQNRWQVPDEWKISILLEGDFEGYWRHKCEQGDEGITGHLREQEDDKPWGK